MKKIILLILALLPFMLSAQVAEENMLVAHEDTNLVDEVLTNDSVTAFVDTMLRPHIEDTIKQEDLPIFITSSEGDTVGVLLTVKQVQELDKKSELYLMLEKAVNECDRLDEFYIRVIDDLEDQVAILEEKVANLQSQETSRTSVISNLQTALAKKQGQLDISNDQLMLDEEIISSLEKDLKREKTKTILGFASGGAAVVGVIVLSILLGGR